MNKALLALVLGLAAAAPAACSGTADEMLGGAQPRRNHPIGEGTSTDTSTTEGSDPGTGNDMMTASADAGAGDASDAAADASADAAEGGATPTAFTGAAAYVATTGPSTLKAAHPNGGNPAKVDCLSSGCHGAGGAGPRFVAGGTVFTSAAATTPAAQVEVRLRDSAGDALSAYTDANGNFFVRAADAAALNFPLATGARTAAATQKMTATIANGACNSAACHGGATGFIHVP